MKNNLNFFNLNKFKYDEIKFKNDPEYKNQILYTLTLIQTFH